MIIAVVGAGGKTTLIKKYAQEYKSQGLKVFVTTTTHMFIEHDTMLTDDADEIISRLETEHYVMAGIAEGKKIRALSEETRRRVSEHADVTLIEADGAKYMPLKFPNSTEPVIPDDTDEIHVVCGLLALGRRAEQCVHRLELAMQRLDIAKETIITAEHVQALVRIGYLEPLRKRYPDKMIRIHASHMQTLYQRTAAVLIENDVDVSLIDPAWFRPQPHLVICGGGHVSVSLAQMAACLDFEVTVMDDREEFANMERFPMAEQVICDSFEHLEKYLVPNGYYTVLTREHRDDLSCVNTILKHSYQYLGMIGSRAKTAATFENLRRLGASEESLASIHAPIGLDIKAQTPAEIAVSILAQMIQLKNRNIVSSASKALLRVKGKGTLCMIISKTGSSPRGIGSMMFVGDTQTIDSVGGGAVEAAVINEARTGKGVRIREYHLNKRDGQEIDMICGGYNQVLFVPLV